MDNVKLKFCCERHESDHNENLKEEQEILSELGLHMPSLELGLSRKYNAQNKCASCGSALNG